MKAQNSITLNDPNEYRQALKNKLFCKAVHASDDFRRWLYTKDYSFSPDALDSIEQALACEPDIDRALALIMTIYNKGGCIMKVALTKIDAFTFPWQVTQNEWNDENWVELTEDEISSLKNIRKSNSSPVMRADIVLESAYRQLDKDGKVAGEWMKYLETGRKPLKDSQHRDLVKQAIEQGEPVPCRVLEAYYPLPEVQAGDIPCTNEWTPEQVLLCLQSRNGQTITTLEINTDIDYYREMCRYTYHADHPAYKSEGA